MTSEPDSILQALIDSQYEDVIEKCKTNSLLYFQALNEAAESEATNRDALHLLSKLCSLDLVSSSSSNPYKPLWTRSDGITSATVNDFSQTEIKAFSLFASKVKDPDLSARLADVAWVITKNYKDAKLAIEKYIESSDSVYCQNNWYARVDRLERALRLALKINNEESVALIIELFRNSFAVNNPNYDLKGIKRISELLLELKNVEPNWIAEKIEFTLSQVFIRPGFESELLLVAATAFVKGKNSSKAKDCRIRAAKALVEEADLRKQEGNMIASSGMFSKAIDILQRHGGDKTYIYELKEQIKAVNLKVLEGMHEFSAETDISELVTCSVERMRNKNKTEAIIQFANICGTHNIQKIEDDELSNAQSTPFQSTFQQTILNSDGRVIAIIPALINSTNEEFRLAMDWRIYNHLKMLYGLHVYGAILPARHALLRQNFINDEVLSEFLKNSVLFSSEGSILWKKGLMAGFYGEFEVLLSLLMPQFENALRKLLEREGVEVWNVDVCTGLHSEKLLGELLALPETKKFFGADLHFELIGLLTNKIAFNFRNETFHGLLSHQKFSSPPAIYLWWLFFRISIIFCKDTFI